MSLVENAKEQLLSSGSWSVDPHLRSPDIFDVERHRPALMSIYELDIGWAETVGDRRHLQWELLACHEVGGVFLTARDDVLAVLFSGDRERFHDWARTLAPHAHLDHHSSAITNPKGARQ